MQWIYKNLYKENIKKECNGIGLFMFFISITMSFISVIMLIFTETINSELTYSNISSFFMSSIASIVSMFITGVIYCLITKTNLTKVICFNKTKVSVLFPLLFLGFGATFIAQYLSSLFTTAVSLFGLTTDLNIEYGQMSWVEILLFILSVSIIPALVEEFAFRGIVLGKLRKYGDVFAIFITAVLFGLIHGNIVQIPFAFFVGLVLGFVTIKANSLLPAIVIHFFNNFISVLFTIFLENNVITEDVINLIYAFIMVLFLITGIVSVAILGKNKEFFKISDDCSILTFREKASACLKNVGMIMFFGYVAISTIYLILVL